MGLINSALNIGRSALLSYQSALQVIGTNISNAGSPDYVRQTPGLTPLGGTSLPEGMRPGSGVALTELKRNFDGALENRIRASLGRSEADAAQRRALATVETLFDPETGLQLQGSLTNFFNLMSDVQNSPADGATRDLAVGAGAALADTLRGLRARLADVGADINIEIDALVTEANSLSERVADLNTEIVAAESSGSPASALRDQRDALVRDLSRIVEVSVRVQPDGSVNVYNGNETLIQGGVSRGLTVTMRLDGEFRRDDVAFADTNAQVDLRGGRLAGLIRARNEDAYGPIDDIDRLAAALIFEVNKVHADGQGLVGFTSVTAEHPVSDTAAALSDAASGLPAAPKNGSFYIAVTGDGGLTTSYQIEIDLDGLGADTSLESLAADISANVSGVTASITADKRLALVADPGVTFTFGHDGRTQRQDSSGALAALGVNTFFSGSSAADIEVNPLVRDRAGLLAAASVNLTGDGANAGRLAAVADTAVSTLGGGSILNFYVKVADNVAVASAAARARVEASSTVLSSLQVQKENISGVSLDEEAVELLKFERAFQGAARFVSVVDRLTSELIALVR